MLCSISADTTDEDLSFAPCTKKYRVCVKNIDELLVRNKYKLKVYDEYLMPSLQFVLTIHFLSKTQLDRLHRA